MHRLDTHLLGTLALIVGGACLVPSVSQAQQSESGRGAVEAPRHVRQDSSAVPATSRPPKGMCRIWLSDVPASQQPAATDCASAVRNRPPTGRVIFGDDYSQPKRDSTAKAVPTGKGFMEMKPPVVFRKHPPLLAQ